MNPIYLSRLSLSDFRSYGPNFCLRLPEGRGLTIIVGPNGLGKTGMFEAIEWGLTGGIERLDGIKSSKKERKECLLRQGSDSESPFVNLEFSDGTKVKRSYTCTPSEEEIKKILVAPGWEGLGNLGFYLRFTHFLGQSSNQRFVARTPEDRWNYVEGPTRIEELWALEQRVRRRKVTTAFSSLENEFVERKGLYEKEFGRLHELLSSRETIAKIARSAQAIDPEVARSKLLDMFEQLTSLIPNLLVPEMQNDAGDLFEQVADMLQTAQSTLNERRMTLSELRPLALEYPSLKRDIDQIRESIEASARESEAAKREQDLVQEYEEKTRQTRESLTRKIYELDSRLERLNWLRTNTQVLDIKQLNLETLNVSLNQYSERRQRIVGEMTKTQARVTANTRRQLQHTALLERRKRLNTLKARCDDFVAAHEAHNNCLAAWKTASAERAMLQTKHDDLVREAEHLRKKKNEINGRIHIVRERTDAIRSAVAVIAAKLTDEEVTCPVCGVNHDQGRLKVLAKRAAEQTTPQLSELEVCGAELEKDIQKKDQEFDATKKALLSIEEKKDNLSQAAARLTALDSDLRLAPELVDQPSERFGSIIQDALSANDRDIAALEEVIKESEDQIELNTEKAKLDAQLLEIDHELDSLKLKRQKLTDELTDLRKQVAATRETTKTREKEPQTRIDRLLAAKRKLEDELSGLQANLRAAEKKRIEADQRATKVESRLKELKDSLAENEQKASIQLKKWSERVGTDTPSLDVWQKMMNDTELIGERLNLLFEKHRLLLENYEAWQQHRMLQDTDKRIESMCKQYSTGDAEQLTHKLKDNIKRSEAKLARLRVTRNKRDQLAGAIHQSNEEVFKQLLLPLNDSINAISATLLPSHRERVKLEARLRNAKSCIFFSLPPEDEEEKLNPELYLSEGQMAALNISLLISASITYPWSRWKALLLDDPLQHNDVIRSSAFIDLLRNMISDQDYQVILSSHDVDEANYFLRKCTNAGIPTAYCHLLAPSDQGVVWDAGYL